MSAISALAASMYALFWQWDPCCKYQVAQSIDAIPRGAIPFLFDNFSLKSWSDLSSPNSLISSDNLNGLSESSQDNPKLSGAVVAENRFYSNSPPLRPVVLVHKDDNRRKLAHNFIAFTSVLLAVYFIFK